MYQLLNNTVALLRIALLAVVALALMASMAWARGGLYLAQRTELATNLDSEAAMLADGADGRWDQYSLTSAALLASGVAEAPRRQQLAERLHQLAERARVEVLAQDSLSRRADALLQWMHREVLTAPYRLQASGLDAPLESGTFNCVSATLLYCCLAERLGIPAMAVEEPGHVRVLVTDGATTQYLETTAGRAQHHPPVSTAVLPAQQRALSGPALVGLIYYNRGIDLLEARQFAAAAEANRRALTLDPSHRQARGNLLAAWNNEALQLVAERKFAQADALLQQGREVAPDHEPFLANQRHLLAQWFSYSLAAGQVPQARSLLERLRGAGVDPALVDSLAARLPQAR